MRNNLRAFYPMFSPNTKKSSWRSVRMVTKLISLANSGIRLWRCNQTLGLVLWQVSPRAGSFRWCCSQQDNQTQNDYKKYRKWYMKPLYQMIISFSWVANFPGAVITKSTQKRVRRLHFHYTLALTSPFRKVANLFVTVSFFFAIVLVYLYITS